MVKNIRSWLVVGILSTGLLFLLLNIKNIQYLLSLASINTKPDIFIYLSAKPKKTSSFWRSFAQGGEENRPMLGSLQPQLAKLKPNYIRIDHVFDNYNTVRNSPSGLVMDWTSLDLAVNQILATGAKPAISLSYFPAFLTKDKTLTGPIKDWADWRYMVRQLILHMSKDRQIDNVVYEVWNEPNLFGRFPMSDSPNGYLTLYSQTIQALPADSNLKPFLIGGPALSHADYKQIKKFVKFTRKKKLRLDFLSFHAYHTNPAKFVREVKNIKQILAAANLKTPVFITEWGVSGDRHPWYNTTRGYWH
ncbi:MAG: hypothetical protein GXP43_03525, partial [bacterium]|nr:hypothetical protein [bacterium]